MSPTRLVPLLVRLLAALLVAGHAPAAAPDSISVQCRVFDDADSSGTRDVG
jgi:hypothetical protein